MLNRSNRIIRVVCFVVCVFVSMGSFAQEFETHFVMAMSPYRLEWNPVYTYTSMEAQLFTAVYEGLVIYDPRTLQPQPGTASSWTISNDKTTYTFNIRPNARWADGTRVTSSDFRDTWIHLLEQGQNAPFAFLLDSVSGALEYRTGRSGDPGSVGIESPDDSTLVIRLEAPSPHFLSILAHQSLGPLPDGFRNDRRWNSVDTVPSNGPYRVESSTETRIEFVQNPYYWDAANVSVERISILLRDDPVQNSRDYNAGAIDWISDSFEINELRSRDAFQIGAQFATTYLFFNCSSGPLSDERVRRALVSLLPLPTLRSNEIYRTPTSRLVPEISGYPAPESIAAQNIDEALELLVEAGYPYGRGIPDIRVVFGTAEEYTRIGELIRTAWEGNLDIEVTLDYGDFYGIQDSQASGDFDLSILSWIGDFADPLTFLELWKAENPVNTAGYNNSEFEDLLARASLLEGTERYRVLSNAESLLLRSGALIPISHSTSINIIDVNEIGGWYINPLDIHPFKNLRFIGERAPSNVASF